MRSLEGYFKTQSSLSESNDMAHHPTGPAACRLCERGRGRGRLVFPEPLTLMDLLQHELRCYWYHLFAQAIRKCFPSLLQDESACRSIEWCWFGYRDELALYHMDQLGRVERIQRIHLFYVRGKSGYFFEFGSSEGITPTPLLEIVSRVGSFLKGHAERC